MVIERVGLVWVDLGPTENINNKVYLKTNKFSAMGVYLSEPKKTKEGVEQGENNQVSPRFSNSLPVGEIRCHGHARMAQRDGGRPHCPLPKSSGWRLRIWRFRRSWR